MILGLGVYDLLGLIGLIGLAGILLVLFFGTRAKRRLPSSVKEALASIPTTRTNQHRVTLILDDDSEIENVYIAYGQYVELSFGRKRLRFNPQRVKGVRQG